MQSAPDEEGHIYVVRDQDVSLQDMQRETSSDNDVIDIKELCEFDAADGEPYKNYNKAKPAQGG